MKDKLKKPGSAAAPDSDLRPLDPDNANVTKFDDNVVSSSSNNCRFGMKSCKLALRLNKVEGSEGEGEIIIGVESIEEEELEMMNLPNPHSTAAKKLMLILSKGMILLQPLKFGQTLLTFSAQVEVGEGWNDGAIVASQSTGKKRKKKKVGGGGGAGGKADELFCEICALLYKRFQKEAVIDEKMIQDLIKNVDNVPALAEDERGLIASSMKLVEEVSSEAKRIAGMVSESIEKYFHKLEGRGAVVGMSVAKVDLSALSLFAELWLLDTYAEKAEHKDTKIHESWFTWEMLINEEGRRTFTIALAPLKTYEGTHHEIVGAEKMVEGTTTGVSIVKELTENTCEWTRALQVDLKISLPAKIMDMVAKLKRSSYRFDRAEAILGGRRENVEVQEASLGSLATSIGFQLILVAIQNRKKGVLRVLKEMAYVVTGMKAPVDAYRVASGAEHEIDTEMDPMLKMTFSKCIEMFTESIPGIIIQASAILSKLESGGTVSLTVWASLLVSVLTTGFVSATIS
ncbi:hypothetical protein TL16_g05817 [Triparma laevis f. inornata]|uniref:Uncharacterized protein n=1 Tax=Triparma laevis f. inornata TaxID=1714386 RepID=A0A9W7AHT8_9STRA|nr:hypothetical protein TL16_g05817 [Triparma laevis f. inornata]